MAVYNTPSDIRKDMFKLLDFIQGSPSIFYVNNKQMTQSRAKDLASKLPVLHEDDTELMQYLKEHIHHEWDLIGLLQKGVAYHHSAMPRYIQNEIIEDFNNGNILYLFSTTTITEGVNTKAKNIVFLSHQKADKNLKGFDIKNIKGRAGRLGHHFIGNVFVLADLVEDNDLDEISFKFFENALLEDEELLQIEREDLSDENQEKLDEFKRNLESLQIPFSLLKENKFIDVNKQIRFIRNCRHKFELYQRILTFTGFPDDGKDFDRSQLVKILKLCIFLMPDSEKKNISFNDGPSYDLIGKIRTHLYTQDKKVAFSKMIQYDKGANIDTKIRHIFDFYNRYLEFLLPRYLKVIEVLYNFVAREKSQPEISLEYLITYFEYGFSKDHECAMKDAGLPAPVIEKTAQSFSDCSNISEIRKKASRNPNLLSGLTHFERRVFKKYV